MKCIIALGSNIGNRKGNLEKAAQILMSSTKFKPKTSPMVETAAVVPEGAPTDWRKPFLNAVLETEWRENPADLLHRLRQIEIELGREPAPKWAPRKIDLDIISFGNQTIKSDSLSIPHPEAWKRQFVLTPLKHIRPAQRIPGFPETALEQSRRLDGPMPVWMGVLNITPDSFSDGGAALDPNQISARLETFELENTQMIDLGAESTRPGAIAMSAEDEWRRLAPALELTLSKLGPRLFRPWISVDTYHPETASRALEMGVDIINDVNGLNDPKMLEVLKGTDCQFVFMHSLGLPADPKLTLPPGDPVPALKRWALDKIKQLDQMGISLDRLIFDPGIGFGKTAEQSLAILQGLDQFMDLPVRIMVGHSRKSFLNLWGQRSIDDRDPETLGISLRLARRGADIIRVHTPDIHQRLFRAYSEV